jgi:hypothetical protein
MEENRTASLVLIHQTGVLKMCNKGSFTLNACICKRSHFLTVELLPFFPIESLIEGYDAGRCYHVDECITHITLILQSCFPHISLAKTNKLVNKIKIQGLCDFGSNFCIQLKCHIYKHRPHIYLEVNGQIYEIISSTVVFINGCQQHL